MKRLDYILVLLLFIAVSLIASLKAYDMHLENKTLRAKSKQVAESLALALNGHIVAKLESQKEINSKTEEIKALAGALKKAHKDSKEARAVRVLEASTGVIEPRDISESNGSNKCLVRLGDKLELSVREVDLKTLAGNYIVMGRIELHRLLPKPKELLASGKFSQKNTTLNIVSEKIDTRWPWWSHQLIGLGVGIIGMTILNSKR